MVNENRRIIIIDDDPGIRDAFSEILSPREIPDVLKKASLLFGDDGDFLEFSSPIKEEQGYDLFFAETGEQGVALVEKMADENCPFALAFIDMKMPGINGAETAGRINAIDSSIKVVIVTAYSEIDIEQIVEKSGMHDLLYLRKPFYPEEIKQFARSLIRQWNLEKEKEFLKERLDKARQKEIETASLIQKTLLMGSTPQNLHGISLSTITIPSKEIDGDFIDFFTFSSNTVDMVLGDVMGKGVPAALLGAAMKHRFFKALYQLEIQKKDSNLPEPREIVETVRKDVLARLDEIDSYFTLIYARFDTMNRKMTFVGCGHPPILCYCKNDDTVLELIGDNMPVGFPDPYHISQMAVNLNPGDVFFIYSDGITEASNTNEELFGDDRLKDSFLNHIRNHSSDVPGVLIKRIMNSVNEFTGLNVYSDDFSCIAVKVL